MPRRSRLQLAGVPFHVIQRGNNRVACFYAHEDFCFYLHHLAQLSERYEVAVHAYVLMTNHVHLLATPAKKSGLSLLMKFLGQRYVQYINRTYRRSGTLWEGRFRSCLVDAEQYLFTCQRYIELNPVRAGMVRHPAEYRWSSYRANAHGERNDLVSPHTLYHGMGSCAAERNAAYRELFRHDLDAGVVDDIRQVTNGGFCLGSEFFQRQVAEMLGRRVVRGRGGRPKAKDAEACGGV